MAVSGKCSAKVICRTNDTDPRYWANTWELDAGLETWIADNDMVCAALAAFHQSVLLPPFTVDRVVLSSWVPDGEPYDPSTFYVKQIQAPGLRNLDNREYQPLTSTLVVKRTGAVGRQGTMLLRGFLHEGDIANGVVPQGVLTDIQTALSAAFATLKTALDPCQPAMLSRNNLGFFVSRIYTDLYAKGCSVKQLRNGRKTKNINSQVEGLGKTLENLGIAYDVINTVFTAFNALPIGDVPLLPAP